MHATGTPSPFTATWYFVPFLPRSVGLDPVRSPPRLARTEQLSRIKVSAANAPRFGEVAAQHGHEQGVHLAQQARARPALEGAAQR